MLFALCFAGTSAGAVQSVVVPVLPDIAEQLHVSASTASWAVTAGLLGAVVMVPVFGRLADLRGGRGGLLWSLALLTLGSVLSALAPSLALLLVGRTLQGAAGAVFPLTITVLLREVTGGRLPSAMALVGATLGVGGGLGPVLSGLLGQYVADYRAVFVLCTAIGALSMLCVALLVPRRPVVHTTGGVDLAGATLLATGLVLVMLPLSQGSNWGWASPTVLGLLVSGVTVVWLFVRMERSRSEPLVSIALMRHRPIMVLNLLSAAVGAVMFLVLLGVNQLVRTSPDAAGYGFGVTSLTAAVVYLLPISAASLVAGLVGGRLVARFGGRATLAIAGVLGTGGFTSLALAHDRAYEVITAGVAVGVMLSLAYAATPTLLTRFAPASQTGMANSANALTRWIGGAAASSFVATVLASYTPAGGAPQETAIVVIFAVGALVSVTVASLARLGLPGHEPDTVGEFQESEPSVTHG
ncbi:MFS transporter [Streptomyces vastus]|uniref:MFS transporter n=1 Tax=Streptomyces vastus TaxID=285451 RepID=A0ABP6DLY5_9ACTN